MADSPYVTHVRCEQGQRLFYRDVRDAVHTHPFTDTECRRLERLTDRVDDLQAALAAAQTARATFLQTMAQRDFARWERRLVRSQKGRRAVALLHAQTVLTHWLNRVQAAAAWDPPRHPNLSGAGFLETLTATDSPAGVQISATWSDSARVNFGGGWDGLTATPDYRQACAEAARTVLAAWKTQQFPRVRRIGPPVPAEVVLTWSPGDKGVDGVARVTWTWPADSAPESVAEAWVRAFSPYYRT